MGRAMKKATPPKAAPPAVLAEEAASECMEFIDKRGAPPMRKGVWIEMLELIISECRNRASLTREELRKEFEDSKQRDD